MNSYTMRTSASRSTMGSCRPRPVTLARFATAQAPAPVARNPVRAPRLQTLSEVEILQQQLRDAEAERDQYEAMLLQHEDGNKQLVNKVRQMAMQQAKTKLALQEVREMLGDAKKLSAAEHLQLFSDRVFVSGKAFKTDEHKQVFVARQRMGMQRLSHYDTTMSNTVAQLQSLLQLPAPAAQAQ